MLTCFHIPLHIETNILDLLLLNVAVTLDQIQSNGGFPSKQKMMYSLPGDRKTTPAQQSSAR